MPSMITSRVLRARVATVEAKYHESGGHIVMIQGPAQQDATRDAIAFLNKYLKS